ncbi:WD40/YVTN/BNR-like repeat-containing protein [Mucilaginibacter agri]|uniref:Oxidoreductase n=1 Tax=Mucilaginibacter agri TaxID=2695265 RepID=A0A965ZIS7_9SPHI|nr:YCF48-related protein [Mucilaginibacter agri]NCD70739.1 oxidoreductase [Mucilaginibacter agri]
MVKKTVVRYIAVMVWLVMVGKVSHAQIVRKLEQGPDCSIRGMSIVDNNVAWISGSKGYVGLTLNGGKTWKWQQVKGFEKSDFRDIEAFSDKRAVIMSAGTPALIMQTTDGGENWEVNYRNDDKAYFLDGMDFFDAKHGVAFGDPIDGKFVMLETNDGKVWQQSQSAPVALPNEAAFAASGTCINIVKEDKSIKIVTGGPVARMFKGKAGNWTIADLPLTHGADSKGAFATADGGGYTVVVGGNYKQLNNRDSTACYFDKADNNYRLSNTMPMGYQSGVCWLGGSNFLSTGTSGTNITANGGKNWKQINTESFNVCKKAARGTLVLLAGDKGQLAVLDAYVSHN